MSHGSWSLRAAAAAGAALLLAACSGSEDLRADCTRAHEPERRVEACTEIIGIGEWVYASPVWAYLSRGDAHLALDRYDEAAEDYERVLELYARTDDVTEPHALILNSIAWSLYLAGRAAEALPHADRALTVLPDDAYIIDTRAHVYAALGWRDDAVAEFERAIQVGGRDWVRQYQEALTDHGFDPGPVDGSYDDETRAALRACIEARCRLME